jgi:hypothetical protein
MRHGENPPRQTLAQNLLVVALAEIHHNCTTTAWRFTALPGGPRRSATSKNRLDSAYDALWRLTVGFGTDLKIMVSPVRIRVPPLKKSCKQRKNKGVR